MSGNNSGWNRPSAQEPTAKKSGSKRPTTLRCVIAVAAVALAIGAACLYFRSGSEETPVEKVARKTTIQERRQAMKKLVEKKTGRPFAEPVEQPKAEQPKEKEDLGWYTNKLGEVKRRTGKRFVISTLVKKSLFTNPAESQLSGIVNTRLGSNYYDYDVPEDFEEQFVKSLSNEIKITDEDTPEEAEKKQRVIEAKEQLKKLWKLGIDIREVVANEKKQIKERFEDYRMFEQGLFDLRANDASPEEIAEYAKAAKLLMDQKNIEEPLALGFEESDALEQLEDLINPKPKNVEGQEVQDNEKTKGSEK